jgi:hypothetical protein
MTTTTLPPVTAAFRDAVRELAMQIGWRNVAKSIAYGPVLAETVAASKNGHKGNGQRMVAPWQVADALLFPKRIPGIKRNARGGLACAPPGGYQREWGDLVGVGTFSMLTQKCRKPNAPKIDINAMLDKEAELGGIGEQVGRRAQGRV